MLQASTETLPIPSSPGATAPKKPTKSLEIHNKINKSSQPYPPPRFCFKNLRSAAMRRARSVTESIPDELGRVSRPDFFPKGTGYPSSSSTNLAPASPKEKHGVWGLFSGQSWVHRAHAQPVVQFINLPCHATRNPLTTRRMLTLTGNWLGRDGKADMRLPQLDTAGVR